MDSKWQFKNRTQYSGDSSLIKDHCALILNDSSWIEHSIKETQWQSIKSNIVLTSVLDTHNHITIAWTHKNHQTTNQRTQTETGKHAIHSQKLELIDLENLKTMKKEEEPNPNTSKVFKSSNYCAYAHQDPMTHTN